MNARQLTAFLTTVPVVVVAVFLMVFASSASHAQGNDDGSTTAQTVSEDALPYPAGLDDPSIGLEDLQLRLIPLTLDQLGPLAVAWQQTARAATQAVIDKTLEIRAADSAGAAQMREERLALLGERELIFEQLRAVLSSYEAKGADPTEVAALRNYLTAISIEETSRLTFQEFMDTAWDWVLSRDGGIQLGFRIVVVVTSLLALFIVARMVRGWFRRVIQRAPNISKLLRDFLIMVVYWLTIAVGLMFVLALLGVNITPLFAVVGGASFIIAFALQDTLGNLAAGLMIMVNRPFDEGDYVSVAGVSGTVNSVSIVSTKVTTPDNRVIVIPNSKVWGDVITNTSASDTRRVDLVFGIGYEDSIPDAQRTIEEVVAAHPLVLKDPGPVIRVNQLSASSVDFICRPWVRSEDYSTVFWDLTRSVKEAFDMRGISIPYPQTEMHLHLADIDNPVLLQALTASGLEKVRNKAKG